MVVGIHQPNYLPWLGYFYKIWASDVFIFHDNIEFSKGNYHQRVYMRPSHASMEKKFLSVSLKQHSDFILFKDLELNQDHNWQSKHLNILRNTYCQAPFYKFYFTHIEALFMDSRNKISFSSFCIDLIQYILGLLDIQRPFYISSDLPIPTLKADYYNAAIVKYLNGTVYLSGIGGRLYQKETTYTDLGIKLQYQDLGSFIKQYPPQYPVPFNPTLSVLDSLFYIGPVGILSIFESYNAYQQKENKTK